MRTQPPRRRSQSRVSEGATISFESCVAIMRRLPEKPVTKALRQPVRATPQVANARDKPNGRALGCAAPALVGVRLSLGSLPRSHESGRPRQGAGVAIAHTRKALVGAPHVH
jgi:hypothetical protein